MTYGALVPTTAGLNRHTIICRAELLDNPVCIYNLSAPQSQHQTTFCLLPVEYSILLCLPAKLLRFVCTLERPGRAYLHVLVLILFYSLDMNTRYYHYTCNAVTLTQPQSHTHSLTDTPKGSCDQQPNYMSDCINEKTNLYTKGVNATAWQQAADCSSLYKQRKSYRLYLHVRHAICATTSSKHWGLQ